MVISYSKFIRCLERKYTKIAYIQLYFYDTRAYFYNDCLLSVYYQLYAGNTKHNVTHCRLNFADQLGQLPALGSTSTTVGEAETAKVMTLFAIPPTCIFILCLKYSSRHSERLYFISWYSTDNRCRELRPYHEEPLFSSFLSPSFVAPLVCFCCYKHTIDYVTRLLPARSLQYIEVES